MNISNTASQLAEEVTGAAKQVADLGRAASERLDEVRYGAADALAGAASSVRTAGRHGSDAIGDLSKSAAYGLDSTSAYVRNHDMGDMMGALRKVVRRYPTRFLVGAAAVGFVFGTAIRRK